MKKIRLLLAAILASVCSIQGMWAERTAPEIPIHTDIVSGQTYYLYNVETKEFAYSDGELANHSTFKAEGFVFIKIDDAQAENTFLLQSTSKSGYYWQDWYPELYQSDPSSPNSSYYRINFAETEGGYLVKSEYRAESDGYYLGITADRDRVRFDQSSGNITWLVLTADQAGRLALYNQLEAADASGLGVYMDKYDAIYTDANSTFDDLFTATAKLQKSLNIQNAKYSVTLNYNEYPILFEHAADDSWSFGNYYLNSIDYYYLYHRVVNGTELTATVEVDQDATFTFNYSSFDGSLDILLDGELYQSLNSYQSHDERRYFVELTPGRHSVTFKATRNSTDYLSLSRFAVQATPTIVVSLSQPGSLGTEVLYKVSHVADVRKLVIQGNINADDWARILMMTNLYSLDLTDCTITEIPERQLSRYHHSSELGFLHEVKLPRTLQTIGEDAFHDTYLDEIEFPEGLTSIGAYAFGGTRFTEAIIPNGVTSIGSGAFYWNHMLQTVHYPTSMTSVPTSCFSNCEVLEYFPLHEGIKSIGSDAFQKCYGFLDIDLRFPTTLTSIGSSAYYGTNIKSVVVPEGVSVGYQTFYGCTAMTSAEFPTSFSLVDYSNIISSCSSLKDLYLKSPTMLAGDCYESFLNDCPSDITIHVPNFVRTTYLLDKYWYNYNIVGFETDDITAWNITRPLTLNGQDRFAGTPDVTLSSVGSLTVNGDAAQPINNLSSRWDIRNSSGPRTMVLANGDNVSVAGTLENRLYTQSKVWDFVSLPFDVRVGDINWQGKQAAVRYYDGAARAANGTGASWKNYGEDDVIPAGTGFIIQTSAEGWNTFNSLDNASKQNIVSNAEFVKPLAANASEVAANKGWNLVGNPWQTWYNIHKLNFTAPITVWNGNNRTYEAYSIQDDDYALAPNQAFFVQCPDEVTSIGFPTSGRQLTSEITDQNGIKARYPQTAARQLIDITLAQGDFTDRTRVVVNAEATLGFEMTRDAQKMRSMDSTVPQLFTVADGMELSINERPLADGIVDLGFYAPQGGVFTIAAVRCQAESVVLEDLISGSRTDLTQDEYNFTADAGTATQRFRLHIQANDVSTDINVLETDSGTNRNDDWYDLSGRRATVGQKGIVVRNGKKMLK